MSPSNRPEELVATIRTPALARSDAGAETIDICNGLGTDAAPGGTGSDSPRTYETVPAMGPVGSSPAQQLTHTAVVRDAGAAPSEASVPSRLGQYEIVRQIGRGGMGTVYLARDLRLGRLVAIKLLSRLDSYDNARFLAEARVTARCNHENIVVIHDVGEHDGQAYMVLEYVAGQTLRTWLDDRARRSGDVAAPIEPSLAAMLMIPVVRALAYAHHRGIVHRDLKPANIMLTDAGTIKVLDFGIAQLLAGDDSSAAIHIPSITEPGAIAGTLPYMSPEQLEGGSVDHRADIWAVGIMLYQMVTGTHPVIHDGVSLHRALIDIASLELPMPSAGEHRADLGSLAGIIDRCLLKDTAHRTRDAHALLQDLEAIAGGRGGSVLSADGNPFAGLAAFQEADADRFYGRAREVGAVLARLRSCPLVALAGPSGVGKSSLVRAGVIPLLKRSGEGWEAFVVRPGRTPLASLSAILIDLAGSTTEPITEPVRPDDSLPDLSRHAKSTSDLGQASESATNLARPGKPVVDPAGQRGAVVDPAEAGEPLVDLRLAPGHLGTALRAWARNKHRRVLVFVDQFEELYTLCVDADERAAFLACLDGVADDAGSPLRVLVSIRSDFLDRLAEHRQLAAGISQGLMLVPPLDRDGLRDALVRPVEAADCRYEDPAIVDDMLAVVAAAPSSLPLLQFAAARLWTERDRDRRVLTRASYVAMGGIAGTLAGHADTVLGAIASREHPMVRAIFERLVTPEHTRAVVSLGELRELPGDPDDIERLIHRLVDARLLVIEARAGDDRVVEIVHESLITGWPTLVGWLHENREDAAFLSRLRTAATQWQASDHNEGVLWRDEPARQALAWLAHYHGELGRRERAYLDAVHAVATRAERRRRRLRRQLIAVAVAVPLILLAVVSVWLVMTDEVRRAVTQQRDDLKKSRDDLEATLTKLRDKERENSQLLEKTRQASEQAEADRDRARSSQESAERARDQATRAAHEAESEKANAENEKANAEQAKNQAELEKVKAEQAASEAEAAREKEAEARKKEAEAAEHAKQIEREKELLRERAVGPIQKELR